MNIQDDHNNFKFKHVVTIRKLFLNSASANTKIQTLLLIFLVYLAMLISLLTNKI